MGYMLCLGSCIRCGRTFSFNPHKVPSTSAITGTREPVCQRCYDQLNALRVKLGLDPWPEPLPGAYEPTEEDEI